MSRHQDRDKSHPGSGDKEVTRKYSNSRGNAPIVKRLLNLCSKSDASKPTVCKGPESPKKPSNPDEIRLNR